MAGLRRRRLLVGLALVACALVAVVGWLAFSPQALRWGLAQAVAASGGRLAIDEVSGRLFDGLRIGRLRWNDAGVSVRVDDARVQWRLRELLDGHIAFAVVQADAVEVGWPAAEDPAAANAPSMPGALGLPWPVLIGAVDVNRIDLRAGDAAPIHLSGLHAKAAYLRGEYRLRGLRVETPWGALALDDLRFGATAPHRLSAHASLLSDAARLGGSGARPDAPALRIDARAEGDLDSLRLVATVRAGDARARLVARLAPLAGPRPADRLGAATLELEAFDPALWISGAPSARLGGRVDLAAGTPRKGRVTVENAQAGRWPDGRLPLSKLSTGFAWDGTTLALDGVEFAGAQGARASGSLRIDTGTSRRVAGLSLPGLEGRIEGHRIDPADWVGGLRSVPIDGVVSIDGASVSVALKESAAAAGTASLTGRAPLSVDARVLLGERALTIERASVGDGESRLEGAGTIALAPRLAVELAGRANGFDPAAWIAADDPALARLATGRLNGRWTVSGGPGEQGWSLALELADSRLAGAALSGRASAKVLGARVSGVDADLRLGANRLQASGAFGGRDDRLAWQVDLAEPAIFDPRAAGRVSGSGHLGLAAGRPAIDGQLDGRGLAFAGGPRIDRAELSLRGALDAAAPFSLRAEVRGLRQDAFVVERIGATVEGTMARHRFELSVDAARQHARAAGTAQFDPASRQWDAQLESGRLEGDGVATLAAGARITVSPSRLAASRIRIAIGAPAQSGSSIELDELSWPLADGVAGGGPARSAGRVTRLPLDRVLAWLDRVRERPEPRTELGDAIAGLRLDGQWRLQGGSVQTLDGEVSVRLESARQAPDGKAGLQLGAGNSARLRLSQGRLDGTVDLSLPSLVFSRRYLGEDWRADGSIRLQARIGGTLASPDVQGRLTGTDLLLEQRSRGWRLDHGELQASFDGDSVRIERLRMASGDGSVSLTGSARLLPDAERDRGDATHSPGLPVKGEFRLDADHFRVPLDPGQRLVLSGRTTLVSDGRELTWRGRLAADEGLIELRSAGAPALPDDVRIVGESAAAGTTGESSAGTSAGSSAESGLQIGADLDIDLGRKIRVIGGGVDAWLEGSVRLQGRLPAAPQVVGTVRVRDGVFEAYGQRLEITSGSIRFNGPIDNPALDITAVRRYLPVEAGAHLTGTALSPRIELVSTPNVPDAEKLSWLVLGVPLDDAGAGAQSLALRQAAATLFGGDGGTMSGSLQQRFGLDVLAVGTAGSTGQNEVIGGRLGGTGLPGASDAQSSAALREVVTVGKRLSSRLFVSYEQGLRGAWNLVRIQYDISRRLSLRLQTGSESAIDLLLFHWFD